MSEPRGEAEIIAAAEKEIEAAAREEAEFEIALAKERDRIMAARPWGWTALKHSLYQNIGPHDRTAHFILYFVVIIWIFSSAVNRGPCP